LRHARLTLRNARSGLQTKPYFGLMWLGVLSLRIFATNENMSFVAVAFFLSAMLI
jgi:hypothetical protein